MKITAKTKKANVVSYIRPSVNALRANCYEKPGQKLVVYPCIEGWVELRRVNEDGARTAEFICRKDVTYDVRYLAVILIKYAKSILKKIKYNKLIPEGF